MTDAVFAASIERLYRRITSLAARGRVTLVDDTGPVQLLQMRLGKDDLQDKLPRLLEYGFSSVPPLGTDGVLLFIAGERKNGVVVATGNQQFRLRNLADGDVALYDNRGQSIVFTKDGLVIDAGSLPITVKTTGDLSAQAASATVATSGNLIANAGGDLTATAGGDASLSGTNVTISASDTLTLSGATQILFNTPNAVGHTPGHGAQFSHVATFGGREPQLYP